jgi:stage IV sporulation protein FB
MEPAEESLDNSHEEIINPDKGLIIYPPKYTVADAPKNLWLKSAMSLLLYLVAGYFFFPDYKILLLITAVVMIHELGHFIAMKVFGYNDVGIFFIPLLGAYVSGAKREVSQLQSAIILLAGPLPGIIIGIVFLLLSKNNPGLNIAGISFLQVGLIFMILNLLNLLPVYPLDGGQLLNRVFLDEESTWSKIFVFISAALMCCIVWGIYSRFHNATIFILLIFPINMLVSRWGENKLAAAEKKIEGENINTNIDYDELPDEDYWKIRNIIIQTLPQFKEVQEAPPFDYNDKEDKIMATVQSLLHRHLLQDVSVAGKILILLIWVAALASPWIMNMQVLNNIGFR